MSRYCKLQFPKHPFAHFEGRVKANTVSSYVHHGIVEIETETKTSDFLCIHSIVTTTVPVIFSLFFILKGWFSYLADCHKTKRPTLSYR